MNKFEQTVADIDLKDKWAAAVGKSHTRDWTDIDFHLAFLRKMKWIAAFTGLLVGKSILFLLTLWVGFVPPLVNSVAIVISFGSTVALFTYYYVLIRDKRDIVETMMLFKKDWKVLKSSDPLIVESKQRLDDELKNMADKVHQAQMREQRGEAKSLKTKFFSFHATMHRFGLCEKEHEKFFPAVRFIDKRLA